ncbi:hypothetical protein VN12_20880 [Pirellula sp. SH-Sr6A]|nr:hypothetical protein VN12_20880 [Pirellula sp. SH-Sr6A]
MDSLHFWFSGPERLAFLVWMAFQPRIKKGPQMGAFVRRAVREGDYFLKRSTLILMTPKSFLPSLRVI